MIPIVAKLKSGLEKIDCNFAFYISLYCSELRRNIEELTNTTFFILIKGFLSLPSHYFQLISDLWLLRWQSNFTPSSETISIYDDALFNTRTIIERDISSVYLI